MPANLVLSTSHWRAGTGDEYRLLLTAAVAIFLLALAMINYGLDDKLTPQSQIKRVLVDLGVAGGIAGMGLPLTGLTATQFTGIIAGIMVFVSH